MQYDLYLVRGSLKYWSNFRNWQNEQLGRLVVDSASWAFYQPSCTEIMAAATIVNIIETETDGGVQLDLVFESADVIGITVAYWPEALPKLGEVAAKLNEFSQAFEDQWTWADPQSEKLLTQLSEDDIREVSCDVLSVDVLQSDTILKCLAYIFFLTLVGVVTYGIFSFL